MKCMKWFALIGAGVILGLMMSACALVNPQDPVASIEVEGYSIVDGVVHIDQPGEVTFDGSGSSVTDGSSIEKYAWRFRPSGDNDAFTEEGEVVVVDLTEGTWIVELTVETSLHAVNCGGCQPLRVEVTKPTPCQQPVLTICTDSWIVGLNKVRICKAYDPALEDSGFYLGHGTFSGDLVNLDEGSTVATFQNDDFSDSVIEFNLVKGVHYRLTVRFEINRDGCRGTDTETRDIYIPDGNPEPTCDVPNGTLRIDGVILTGTPKLAMGVHNISTSMVDNDDCHDCGAPKTRIQVWEDDDLMFDDDVTSTQVNAVNSDALYKVQVTFTDDDCRQDVEVGYFTVEADAPVCVDPTGTVLIDGVNISGTPELTSGNHTISTSMVDNDDCHDCGAPKTRIQVWEDDDLMFDDDVTSTQVNAVNSDALYKVQVTFTDDDCRQDVVIKYFTVESTCDPSPPSEFGIKKGYTISMDCGAIFQDGETVGFLAFASRPGESPVADNVIRLQVVFIDPAEDGTPTGTMTAYDTDPESGAPGYVNKISLADPRFEHTFGPYDGIGEIHVVVWYYNCVECVFVTRSCGYQVTSFVP